CELACATSSTDFTRRPALSAHFPYTTLFRSRGPRGTGFSYTHARLRDSAALSFHDLHVASVGAAPHATVTVDTDSARIWETAERSTVATVGLAEALRHHFAAGAAPYDRALSQRLRTRLTDIVGPSRLVDPGEVLSNMVTVDTHPVPAGEVVSRLRQGS